MLYFQDPDAELDAHEKVSVSVEEARHRAETAFREVFENGPKIELDHYIVYYARGSHLLSFCIHVVRWTELVRRFRIRTAPGAFR
jgi:hypothetical protein